MEIFGEEKKRVYLERCQRWREWCALPDRDEAVRNGETEPAWPSYPYDSVVKDRATARSRVEERAEADAAQEARDKAHEEMMETSRQSTTAVLGGVQRPNGVYLLARIRKSEDCTSLTTFSFPLLALGF